ncbi:ribosomal protein S5 domain 2-like superfamily protein [Wolffia australiana]
MRFRFLSDSLLRLGSRRSPSSILLPPIQCCHPLNPRSSLAGSSSNAALWVLPSREFSSKDGKGGGNKVDDDGNGSWKFGRDDVLEGSRLFGNDSVDDSWTGEGRDLKGNVFQEIDGDVGSKGGAGRDLGDEWATAEGYKPWGFEEEGSKGEIFAFGEDRGEFDGFGADVEAESEKEKADQLEKLEKEEKELLTTLKGPNRAFGDLISASGITEDMVDSLILLKDLRGVQGLPPLTEIEDMKLAKDDAPSARFEMERKKQEEVAKARVRQVDERGRAYGSGGRKCSSARVWIEPGDGKFFVNEKPFDVYFPMIDHRADLLRPFSATKTLGLFDVNCTVKGGGVSGQVGAIRLGISRALQNFEPGLRENLRSLGLLTRDSRIVERKKPGKAKARKSFQWVKR